MNCPVVFKEIAHFRRKCLNKCFNPQSLPDLKILRQLFLICNWCADPLSESDQKAAEEARQKNIACFEVRSHDTVQRRATSTRVPAVPNNQIWICVIN